MKRANVRAGLVVCALMVAAAGCARRPPEPPDEAMPPEVRAAIGEWMTLVSRALPGTTADSLGFGGKERWRPDYAWIGDPALPSSGDDPRWEYSPDGRYWLEPNMYRDIPEDGGEPGYDADSAPLLGTTKGDSVWRLAFVGTMGRFEDARWLDAKRFVLFSQDEVWDTLEAAPRRFAWSATLWSLADSTRTTWTTRRAADEAGYWRYSAAIDSYVVARVQARRAAIARQ